MKKYLSLLLVLVMAFALAGCNKGTSGETPVKNDAPAATTPVAQPSADNNAKTTDFPNKPITFICPYSAGGSSDMMSRALCGVLEKYLNVPVNVENKSGGSGAVGATYLLSRPADGYTLLYGTTGMLTTLPHTQDVGYDEVNDFTYLGCFAMHDILLVVPADSPYQTLDDYITAAKAGVDKVSYGQTSVGGANHIIMEQFQEIAGIDLNMIVYDGGASEVTAALLGGHLESAQLHPADVIEHLKAGTIRALAIFAEDRSPALPDVPTMKECGIELSAALPRGVVCHGDTPAEIVEILEKAIADAVQDPEFKEAMTKVNEGNSIHYMNGADFKKALTDMTQAALPIMDRLGMLPN